MGGERWVCRAGQEEEGGGWERNLLQGEQISRDQDAIYFTFVIFRAGYTSLAGTSNQLEAGGRGPPIYKSTVLLRAVYHYPVICKRSNRGEIEVGGVGCLVVWVGGGARPKNRRWNTWRPDDEGNTPVPLSALDKPPFPIHKSSIFWAFASSPRFLEFNTWVEDPEVDQLVLVRHTVTMVECDKVPCCFYLAFCIY